MATTPAPNSVSLPIAPDRYDRSNEQQARQAIEQAIERSVATQNPPIVTGTKGGNAAVESLIAALVTLGFIVDQTT